MLTETEAAVEVSEDLRRRTVPVIDEGQFGIVNRLGDFRREIEIEFHRVSDFMCDQHRAREVCHLKPWETEQRDWQLFQGSPIVHLVQYVSRIFSRLDVLV